MAKGTVVKFIRDSYGFIAQEDGSEVFFHWKDLDKEDFSNNGFVKAVAGDEVEFEVVPGDKPGQMKAVNVVKVK